MKIRNNLILRTGADFARDNFNRRGLDLSDIKVADFYFLIGFLAEELERFSKKSHEGIHSMKVSNEKRSYSPKFVADKNGGMLWATITVDSHYFEGREAFTFNNDGWVSISGWADKINSIPFVDAFNRFTDYLNKKKKH